MSFNYSYLFSYFSFLFFIFVIIFLLGGVFGAAVFFWGGLFGMGGGIYHDTDIVWLGNKNKNSI